LLALRAAIQVFVDDTGAIAVTLRTLRKEIESRRRLWCRIIARTDSTLTGRTTVLRGKSGIGGLGVRPAWRAALAKGGVDDLGGVGVHQGKCLRTRSIGLALLAAVAWGSPAAAQSRNVGSGQILEPVVWQGPEFVAQLLPTGAGATTAPNPANPGEVPKVVKPSEVVVPPAPIPPQTVPVPVPVPVPVQPGMVVEPRGPIVVPPTDPTPPSGLLDDGSSTEELMPPVVDGCYGGDEQPRVQPYGGGHPTDWSWGCGGSPYRTGPGICDNYKVGPRWHWTFDGLVMTRDETDLNALMEQMIANDPTGTENANGPLSPALHQFDHGPGGRITFTSQIGRCTGYDVQAVYEGINDWNASIVYPKLTTPDIDLPIPPDPNTEPPSPFPERFEQRSLHYRSSLNSGELNFIPNYNPTWRPFFGVRFIKFDDTISDFLNQETQVPLPGPLTTSISPGPVPPAAPIIVNDPIGPTHETDRLNLFDLENNLMGFQVGLLHDTVRLNERLAIEGFVNGGVYYDRVKYSNVMGVFTTQTFADNTRSTGTGDGRTDESNIVNNDHRELSEISYVSEASISGVCRLNKCWALRGGYQVLWIANVHLADAAYLGNPEQADDMLFHGWHAGIECRR
jgi:hypothetical protein